jgi:hypothetical protein
MTDFTIAAQHLAAQAVDLQRRLDLKGAELDEVTTQLAAANAALTAAKTQLRELKDVLGYGAGPKP